MSVAAYGEDADQALQNCILCILSNKEAVKTSRSCQDFLNAFLGLSLSHITSLLSIVRLSIFVHLFSYFIISADV